MVICLMKKKQWLTKRRNALQNTEKYLYPIGTKPNIRIPLKLRTNANKFSMLCISGLFNMIWDSPLKMHKFFFVTKGAMNFHILENRGIEEGNPDYDEKYELTRYYYETLKEKYEAELENGPNALTIGHLWETYMIASVHADINS